MLEFEKELGVIAKWEPESADVLMGIEPVVGLSEALSALANESRLMEPSKDIVGEENIELFTGTLNFERARQGGAVRLHQDYAYWADAAPVAHRVATGMLFLDDATIEKGCLEVAAAGKWILPNSMNADWRPLEAEAGSVVWFGAFLVHRSLPNLSNDDRRAILYSYQPAGNPRFRHIWRN